MLFVQEQYQYLKLDQTRFTAHQFENQEYRIQLLSSVQEQRCLVVGSLTAPVDQQILLLLLLQTLSKAGAFQITLFCPYLGYQRQDACLLAESCGIEFADRMLQAAGVSDIVTIDPHNVHQLSTLRIPVVAHTPQELFFEDMARYVAMGFTFVFPDDGSALRRAWITDLFPAVQQGFFVKQRVHGFVELQSFRGKVGRKVIVYDDILDTGQTLLQVCIGLRQMGADEIVIFVTHGFFHGQAWQDLWGCGVRALYCSDSLPQAHSINHLNIYKKSIIKILQKTV